MACKVLEANFVSSSEGNENELACNSGTEFGKCEYISNNDDPDNIIEECNAVADDGKILQCSCGGVFGVGGQIEPNESCDLYPDTIAEDGSGTFSNLCSGGYYCSPGLYSMNYNLVKVNKTYSSRTAGSIKC